MSLQENESLAELSAEAHTLLGQHYQQEPSLLASAPGRVNLIGEHIDYCDGFVLPLAIDRHIVIAAALNDSATVRVRTMEEAEVIISLNDPQKPEDPAWANYLRGVLDGFRLRGNWPLPGFNAVIVSNVPVGGGLSSSAALELSFATLLEGFSGTKLDAREKALLCQQAEHDFAGVPCGIMDQFASAFGKEGHLVLIDCQSREPALVPFHTDELSILVANTMVRHDLATGEYRKRREDTEQALALLGKSSWRDVSLADLRNHEGRLPEVLQRRARHVVTESSRTREAAEELRTGNPAALGPLMAASHQSLRDDFEVSYAELALMVQLASDIGPAGGLLGSRMTGGGFGGCTVSLCRSEQLPEIAACLAMGYERETGLAPQIFSTRPAGGARLL